MRMNWYKTSTAKQIIDSLLIKRNALTLSKKINWISTLVRCPRRVALEGALEKMELLRMIRGSSIHEHLELGQISEVYIKLDDIEGKIDIIRDVPVEIFATSMSKPFEPELYPLKVNQLAAYVYMLKKGYSYKSNTGEIMIFHLMSNDVEEAVESAMVEFTDEELQRKWDNLMYNRQQLQMFIDTEQVPDMNPTFTMKFLECTSLKCKFKDYCWK
jgi:hypothetical protein